jgi:hypothetical protein
MKQNNKFKKFGKTNSPEKCTICTCGAKAKLKSNKNYPFGKKSKAIISQYYKCDECNKITFTKNTQKGGQK